jgi:hypothetical protein
MTPDMAFECLLVSRDPGVVCIMNKLLGNLSISTNICLTSTRAIDQLSGGSTDLVVVDCEDESAEFLRNIQKSANWHKPTVVAVSSTDYPVHGAHVVVHKPATEASVAKALKAAYTRMLYDYRRHARYAMMSSVKVTGANSQPEDVTITNIGDGGVGLSSKKEFAIGEMLSFHLLLPGTERAIYVEARVQWSRNYGVLGCEYVRIPPVDLNILHDWLINKAQIKKPLVDL